MSSCLKCIHGRRILLCCKSNVLHVYQKEHAYIWNGKMGCLTSTIASFMHFATSLTRHSAIVIFWSFIIAANLWRCSALFHKGTFAHSFCAALQLSTHLLTSSWVQAVEKMLSLTQIHSLFQCLIASVFKTFVADRCGFKPLEWKNSLICNARFGTRKLCAGMSHDSILPNFHANHSHVNNIRRKKESKQLQEQHHLLSWTGAWEWRD